MCCCTLHDHVWLRRLSLTYLVVSFCLQSVNRHINPLTDFIMNRDTKRRSDDVDNHSQVVLRPQASIRIKPVSCVDQGVLPTAWGIVPYPERHQIYINRRPYYINSRERLRKTVWTSISRDDVLSMVGIFFHHLWPHLKKFHRTHIENWIVSRKYRVHQEHCNVFSIIECPGVLRFVRNTNYRKLLDLMVKLVVDYQNILLLMRKNVPWKRNS